MSVAKVAVDNIHVALDREYDYLIPEGLSEQICIGCRVAVPFGGGNRLREGVVVAVMKDSSHEKLKSIVKVVGGEYLLTPEMCALAAYMRKKVFCTYFDAFHAMLPLAMRVTLKEVYVPQPVSDKQEELLGERAALLLKRIREGKRNTREAITNDFGSDAAALLSLLTEAGMIKKTVETPQRTDDAFVKSVRLIASSEEAASFAASRKGNQAKYGKAIDILSGRDAVPLSELCYLAGVTRSVPDTLCKYGIAELSDIEVYRNPYRKKLLLPKSEPNELNEEQQQALNGLIRLYNSEKAETALLFGVTGSGKTNVYMSLIDHALKTGGNTIVLVPEISLTPQLTDQFFARFGDRVAVLHSGLSVGERYDEWKRVKNGDARIVVGTRSAVFAPFEKVDLIILDEEQEGTYKSESSPRYHARDIARFRAAYHKSLLVLASATPSLETYSLTETGKISRFELTTRYHGQMLPEVLIADLTNELKNGNPGTISTMLKREIEKNLEAGEQIILFLNRRGYNTFIGCPSCGHVMTCPNCSVSYTYHSVNNLLMCHYCGAVAPVQTVCPQCGTGKLRYFGAGTQRVEEEVQRLFPEARTLRMDFDTTNYKQSHEKILSAFHNREADILIGTQMVTKGLDMPGVTLVGVLLADSMLFSDDFRAGERSFSLLTQVVGRAGRADKHGRAVIQTYNPTHELLHLAQKQDYKSFYKDEILFRKTMIFPPYCDLFSLSISGEAEETVKKTIGEMSVRLAETFRNENIKNVILYNPAPSVQVKLNNRYRYRMIMKGRQSEKMSEILRSLQNDFSSNKKQDGMTLSIDVNPLTIL